MTLVSFGIVVLLIASFMCLVRIGLGPTPPDRSVAIDVLGTLIVGFACMMALVTGQEFYMNIALAWALLSFIGTVALAKYLEGRSYDE
ncbi:cation:proton antiporter [bacterium]|nr:cation:proton antiporter [bacterium]